MRMARYERAHTNTINPSEEKKRKLYSVSAGNCRFLIYIENYANTFSKKEIVKALAHEIKESKAVVFPISRDCL